MITVWAIIYAFVLSLPWFFLDTQFIPVIRSVWEILFYVGAFFYPCVLLPCLIYEMWQEKVFVKRHVKILKTLGLFLYLIPIGYLSLIAAFAVSFGRAFDISIVQVACSGSSDVFYVREGRTWMDDDPGSVNEAFTLYRRNLIILEPIAEKAIHTRGDRGYEDRTVDPKSPSTVIEFMSFDKGANSVRYSYAPAQGVLRCY
jgi:hypothetical protein